jgi:hypothetical protein
MKLCSELDRNDLTALEHVAEGRASALSPPIVDRLLALGLVQESASSIESAMGLQLTTAGLSLIRSSDQ